MRIIAFYICLCLFLLSGGKAGHAHIKDSHQQLPAPHAPVKRSHSKINNTEKGSSILDEAEIDLDEDSLGDHDADDPGTIKSLASNRSFYHSICLTFSSLSLLNSYGEHSYLPQSLQVLSSPLYITQRVLRI